jgi:hypothetical protein
VSGHQKPAIAPGVSTDSSLGKPAISAEAFTDSGATKPAIDSGLSTDSGELVRRGRAPSASACEPFHEEIAEALRNQRNAKAICQDLVDDHGFQGACASVNRFVPNLRGGSASQCAR